MLYAAPFSFIGDIQMKPVKYEYKLDQRETIAPALMTEPSIPVAFSIPCYCSKY